jgi:hypothetical protein
VAVYWYMGCHHACESRTTHLRRMSERKILYYPNPMGAPDTSLVPKKDPMGMDCIRPNVLSISRKHARRSRG